jgi:hypothetical protein
MFAVRPVILLFCCVLVSGIALFGRHNNFPFYYHPDEPGKVQQIIRHKRSFTHPMLMLSTVDAVRHVVFSGADRKAPQKLCELGRWATAVMCALTAATLACLAFQTFGMVAGCSVGLLVLTQPLLYDLAHYFKEDPWLMAGIALVCLALNAFCQNPSARRLHLLAVACALAASGKYVGFVYLPVCAWMVWRKSPPGLQGNRLLAWFASFTGVLFLLNFQGILNPGAVLDRIQEESVKLSGAAHGVGRQIPHGFYLLTQSLYGGWTLPLISLLWVAAAVRMPRKITPAEWVLCATALLQFAVFSCVPKAAFRYHLPVALAFVFLAVAGLARCIEWLRDVPRLRSLSVPVAAGLLAAALFFQVRTLWVLDRSFIQDDRARLIEWIRSELPASAVLAADAAVNLPDLRLWQHAGATALNQRIVGGKKEVGEMGSIAELRAQGVTHIAICGRTYARYLDLSRQTHSQSARMREFYQTLLTRGEVLWSSPMGSVNYLQPGLQLVDIQGL